MVAITEQLSRIGEDRYMAWDMPILVTAKLQVGSNYLYWQFLTKSIEKDTPLLPGIPYVHGQSRRALTGGSKFLSGSTTFFEYTLVYGIVVVDLVVDLKVQGTMCDMIKQCAVYSPSRLFSPR